MPNLQHIKGSRTRVLNTFPTKTFGNDGDIVISRINGKGVFLCSKAGGMWYAANKMQELNRFEKTSIRELTTNKLTVNKMINTERSADRFVVNDGGSIKYRTGEQVVGDLPLPFDNIAYKTAYCSLGQYSDKDSCESNGGTWYYSENDSHDSISSTAENQLLTVGQSIGTVDAESKLLYNGSTLEIKYDTDFDDNWQTEATAALLKLSYDSDKYATIGIDSDKLTFNLSHDGEFWFTERSAAGLNVARVKINTDTGVLTILNPASILDYFAIDVNANGATEIKTSHGIGGLGAHLTLNIAGDIELNADSGQVTIKDGDDSHFLFDCDATSLTIYDDTDAADLFSITVAASGATTIATVDDGATVGHLTLVPDGDLILDPVSDTVTIVSNLTVGVDDAGYDVKFFGDTASNYMLWDTSADCLHLVTTNASTSQLIIESTDDGSNHSPDISIYRNSASPADSDTIGRIMFHGEDSGGNQTLYASIKAKADDVTAGSESGRLELRVAEYNGGLSTGVRLTGSATVDGDVDVEIPSGNFTIDATKKLYFDGGTHTYLDESSDDVLDIVVGGDKMLILDEANDKITMGATNWVAGTVSGDTVTEFSVANSAYAGMIIGYRMIGEDASRTTYTLTTSFVVPDDDMGIRFIAPPSGAVEIMIQIKVDAQANNTTFIGLSTANATSGYSTAGATYEQAINLIDETDNATIQHYWAVTGLTAGDTYNYWVGFKKQSSGIGNGYLNWGGGSGEHCDFIMKATALPTAVSDFAEYD